MDIHDLRARLLALKARHDPEAALDAWRVSYLQSMSLEDEERFAHLLVEIGPRLSQFARFGNQNTILHELAQIKLQRSGLPRGSGPDSLWGHATLIGALKASGFDLEARNLAGRSALHSAVFNNNLAMARALLDAGADLHAVDSSGDTPLHDAALGGHVEIARELLGRGARASALNRAGEMPWAICLERGHAHILGSFLAPAEREALGVELAPEASAGPSSEPRTTKARL